MPRNSGKPSLISNIKARFWAWWERHICADNSEWAIAPVPQWPVVTPYFGMPTYFRGPAREAHKLPMMTSDYETWLCQDFLTRTQFRFTFKWWDMDDRDSYYMLIGKWVTGGDRL